MSDGRKSGVFCSPQGSCTLSSCWNLPNYRIDSGRHLDIHTRAFRMTSADVKTCLTRLKGWWGSLSCTNTQGMEVFIIHAQGITMAHSPIFRLLGLFSSILLLMLNRELHKCVDLTHNLTLSSRLQNRTPRQDIGLFKCGSCWQLVPLGTCRTSPRSAVLISGSSVVLKGTGVILTKVRTRGSG